MFRDERREPRSLCWSVEIPLNHGVRERVKSELLLGDEAAAQGAIDAGIGGVFSYPGTPATEIFEYIEEHARQHAASGISAMWSANEKVAYEEALGMSYAGKRALVSMKHVGLNVAADPFMSSAITGVNAGVVLIVADDPGMHSSQNEQDTRFYAEFAQVPLFEPGTQQGAYDQVMEAFEYSEAVGLPVVVRMVTRLCHSRAHVRLHGGKRAEGAKPTYARPDPNDWVLVPSNARRRYRRLLELQPRLQVDAETSGLNTLRLAGKRGIIAAGIARNYVGEALGGRETDSLLHIQRYPLPAALVRKLVEHCDDILVVEDGYPFIEQRLNGLLGVPGKTIRGRLTGDLPRDGELTPDSVASGLGVTLASPLHPLEGVTARPPQLCKGCPHSDSFKAIVEASSTLGNAYLFSDVGCYALGVAPPLRAVHSCVDMGASIAMAHGAAQAGAHPVICTIGDSTFAHSGMTPLIGAAKANANITVFVLDNATVGMTGTQESMSCGERLIEIIKGLGVEPAHLHVIDPLPKKHAENVALIRREIEYKGLSVIVPRRACIHVKRQTRPVAEAPASAAEKAGGCGGSCACTPVTISAPHAS
jgi:indolepyruvate ferredoxin oxidoreductase alpha subunit